MKAIKFNLTGNFAFFKKPDVNSYVYFTYSNIHKISVLGILGAILGLKGYNQQKKNSDEYPEFYEKLNNLQISIVPSKNFPVKKIQVFNNSVGYASKEEGGNLIIKEQWIENPEWDIFIIFDENNELLNELAQRLLNNRFVYLPYLGKNDHYADIKDVEIIELSKVENVKIIDSLIFANNIEKFNFNRNNNLFKYMERLPYKLEKVTNHYEYLKFVHTTCNINLKTNENIFNCNELNLFFF